jgi:YD repeat-containing protein
MSVTVAGISFDHHEYDQRGDVLYLSVTGYTGPPARAYASPEGHNVEYDDSGRVIAMTLVNVRWLLDRDGELTITWPAGHVHADELAEVLAQAA